MDLSAMYLWEFGSPITFHVAKQQLGLLEESGNNYFPSTEITRGGISENIYRLLLTQ